MIAWPFCLPHTEGPLNTGTFWGGKQSNKHSTKKRNKSKTSFYLQYNKEMHASEPQRQSMFHLKSVCVMAWEESFSNIRVTGRCNGWFETRSMCWQWVRSVETSPPSHITWRFRSDFTMAWMWWASENWTSLESWERGEESLTLRPNHVLNSMQHWGV